MRKLGFWALALGVSVGWASVAAADAPKPVSLSRAATGAWSEKAAHVADDVQAGKPLVIEVFVPLCADAAGGPCGKHAGAGDPANLEDNLYWGAVFGARRFFDRKYLGWTRTEAGPGESWELERATYKRSASGSRWGTSGSIDVFVVLHAINGDAGDDALRRFRDVATSGGSVKFNDGSGVREERVHAVGFMGRNPLLENGKIPKHLDLPEPSPGSGTAAFSIAAYSRETLGPWLQRSGSRSVILARGAAASEGYVLDSVAQGLANNEASWTIAKRTTKAYARWHRLPEQVADIYFNPRTPKLLQVSSDDKPAS